MKRDRQNGLQCSQFETLLADALDFYGQPETSGSSSLSDALTPEMRQAFEEHRASCPNCNLMFAETQNGMALLSVLPEVDPPKHLVHNILARTSGAEAAADVAEATVRKQGLERWLQGLRLSVAGLRHSRFASSFAMAFFSLSLTLTLAGVRVNDLAKAVQHPSTLRKSFVLQYTQMEARLMRYYDSMRWVYEVESRVQQLKKATAPQNSNKPEQQNWKHDLPGDDQLPERRENVVQERDSNLIAEFTVKPEGAHL